MESTLTSKGKITLPKKLREELQLRTGDRVLFERQEDGSFTLRPRTIDVTELKGCLRYTGSPMSLEKMGTAIAKNAG